MPLRFPAWADTAMRGSVLAIGLGIPGVILVPMIYVRTPFNLGRAFPVDQPVQFDHRHHVLDDRIDCLYCHSGAEHSPHAGIPPTELCMGCHAQIWNQSPMLEPLRRSYFSGLPMPWNRVHDLPDFVFFNHAVHVQGGVTCQECHGDVARMPAVHQVAPLTMGWCLDCHRARGVRPAAREDTVMARVQLPGDARRIPPIEMGVPPLQNCTTCHR